MSRNTNNNIGIRKSKIPIGSIVYYRHRNWRYIENINCLAHLVLLEGERPAVYENGEVTECKTDINNVVMLTERKITRVYNKNK